MLKVFSQSLIMSLLVFLCIPEAFSQPVLPSDLKKPKKYENRKLGAEKTTEKKFKLPRKFIQNTVTHYNWYFNANNRLNEIVERAKSSHIDDYAQLLPFYNYDLDVTAASKSDLDSVIIKANTGILTHDLRNSWIDNLYMLMGKAYYFRNDLDSAYLTFQYVNYAFSPKEKDGYDIPIGSNATEGNSALSVSTKEKTSVVNRAFTTAPSRNESFIWQIRTYIMRDRLPEAAALIATLKNDAHFPERLQIDLNEVQALYFYQQQAYDSAAFYLEGSLDNAANRQEASRWEYLTGQLYALAKRPQLAIEFFDRARKRTLDPVLEVYAILNSIRQNSSDSAAIKENIEELRKMGRRDKYETYRDIIYYTAAQIELERKNVEGAKAMLMKSTAATALNVNPAQRSRSFLLLADLFYNDKDFPSAKRYYDSVNNNDPGVPDPVALEVKKQVLTQIVSQIEVIHRQDSLQKLASMPAAEREALLKKMVRAYRKKYGIREVDQSGNAAVGMGSYNRPAPDLFNAEDKGDWYFYNPSLKSKGFTAFKQKWGNRPNVDNWRRQSNASDVGNNPRDNRTPAGSGAPGSDSAGNAVPDVSFEGLLANIPLTPEKLKQSQDSVETAMIELGAAYVNKMEEYPMAIQTLEEFLNKFPSSVRKPEALYYLYYAYMKTGNSGKASAVRADLDNKYPDNKYQQLIYNSLTGADTKKKGKVTNDYEKIYNLFIEGNFEQAIAQKKIADSIYGTSYWTPQLLYIESVYYLHARKDEEAKQVLNNIIQLYPEQPMAEKAKNILEVLGRRKEIEDYLTQLQITRSEDSVAVANAQPMRPERIGTPMEQDSTRLLPKKLSNIDSNTTGRKPEITAQKPIAKQDTVRAEVPTNFTFHVEAPHAVVVVLNKVDPVYVTESRNAFNRYNQANLSGKQIDITNQPLNDTVKLVVMSGFENAAVALGYMQNVQAVAAKQIVPWLPADKYSFLIISSENLEVLKNNQDFIGYKRFHEKYLK
jgi:tetratricopeptide (TPR) repeat protein